MAIFVGDNEPSNIYAGTTPVKEVYIGTEKVWPVYTQDFRAFRFFLYGDDSSPAPYEVNYLEANQWTNSGRWCEFRTVFQFTNSFWAKKPVILRARNMYYSLTGSTTVKPGILFYFPNPGKLKMEEIYEAYNFNSIIQDCTPVTLIPGGAEYFDLDLSLLPERYGVYVLSLGSVYNDSRTYASTTLMSYGANFPCKIITSDNLQLESESDWL